MATNIRDFLPNTLRQSVDKFTQTLFDAINANDTKLEQLIQACIDQLFLSTASGKYLVQLGEEQGFTMPVNSGLDIRAFRVLVPLMVSSPKQIRQTFDQILAAFYGTDRTRPSITSSIPEPFNLSSGDDIIIETETGRIGISVLSNQVSSIGAVTAPELAAVYNATQSLYTADTITDKHTGQRFLRLTSAANGAVAFIRVVGGTVQNVLKFPKIRKTLQIAGTTWNVAKEKVYTDVTKIQWDGVGQNPNVFLTKAHDILTIRGLVDGIDPLSKLNGSYEIVESGYDYVIVRNTTYKVTTGTIVQAEDDTFLFTSFEHNTLYDQAEYALTSETEFNTATVTVPAIPPLARRFLQGSAHLHGTEAHVLNFARSTVQVAIPAGATRPIGENAFVLASDNERYDFTLPLYRTTGIDASTDPIFNVDAVNAQPFPFTVPQPLSNPFRAEIGRSDLVVTFPHVHGMHVGWSFTIAGAVGTGTFTTGLLNAEHTVKRVIDDHTVVIELRDPDGFSIFYDGNAFAPFDVYQQATMQGDSDFLLRFASSGAAIASGLQPGMIFRIDPSSGVNISLYYGNKLRYRDLYVTLVAGTDVYFAAGLGTGASGEVISGASGHSSQTFGGAMTYFFDQSSVKNVAFVMSTLKMVFLAFTPEANKAFIGSFLYDPLGLKYNQTVSGFTTKTTVNVLKGSNDSILFVNQVKAVFNGQDFPSTGQVVVDWGTDRSEGPIGYLATISSDVGQSQILLDPSYRFKKSHSAGAQIQYVRANAPFVPSSTGTDYPVYLTGTAQARNTLFVLLNELKASGVFLKTDIILPQLLYVDSAIPPFE